MNEKITDLNKKIEKTEKKISFLKKKLSLKAEYKKKIEKDSRKARAHKLITKGALLEMLNLLDEDNEVLLGFFSTLLEMSNLEKNKLKEKGKELFEKHKKK